MHIFRDGTITIEALELADGLAVSIYDMHGYRTDKTLPGLKLANLNARVIAATAEIHRRISAAKTRRN